MVLYEIRILFCKLFCLGMNVHTALLFLNFFSGKGVLKLGLLQVLGRGEMLSDNGCFGLVLVIILIIIILILHLKCFSLHGKV